MNSLAIPDHMADPICILDASWVGPKVRFVADPFLRRDGDRWLLFFEVMWDDNSKQIGVAESPDLVHWELLGYPLGDAPCSFPHVLWYDETWWMFPNRDHTPDLLVYQATGAGFPMVWHEWARFELDESANDRLVIRNADRLVVLYGSRAMPWGGTCLKWGELLVDKPAFVPQGYVRSRSPIQWMANRAWGKPITTYRPAGDELALGNNTYLPLQAYGARREYGGQFGLFDLTFSDAGKPRIKAGTYFTGNSFVSRWDATHHISSQRDGDHLILAVDGRTAESMWEVAIFRIDIGQELDDWR